MSWLRIQHVCNYPQACSCDPGPSAADLVEERARVGQQSGPGELAPVDPFDDYIPDELPRSVCGFCGEPKVYMGNCEAGPGGRPCWSTTPCQACGVPLYRHPGVCAAVSR